MTLRVLSIALACLAITSCQSPQQAVSTETPENIIKTIENRHPADYYLLASKLYEQGKKDDAVVWFYIGQIRFRYYLAANPNLEPSGDPALFASLSNVVGQPINEYAGSDPAKWVDAMEAALTWDDEHPNGFTSKDAAPEAYKNTRQGLAKLIMNVKENGIEIKQQRQMHGLK